MFVSCGTNFVLEGPAFGIVEHEAKVSSQYFAGENAEHCIT